MSIDDPGFTSKRRHIRSRPDPLDHAYIAFDLDGPFNPTLVALIVEEAPMGGCGLALLNDERLKNGVNVVVKVGRLAPLKAVVVWVRAVDDTLMRVGLKFLE